MKSLHLKRTIETYSEQLKAARSFAVRTVSGGQAAGLPLVVSPAVCLDPAARRRKMRQSESQAVLPKGQINSSALWLVQAAVVDRQNRS
jgi:hypothetical protein